MGIWSGKDITPEISQKVKPLFEAGLPILRILCAVLRDRALYARS
jgi:hypothetical protein